VPPEKCCTIRLIIVFAPNVAEEEYCSTESEIFASTCITNSMHSSLSFHNIGESPPRDLQILVCSCVPSKWVLLQIAFCLQSVCVIVTTLHVRSLVKNG